jgi:viroplasmin and RNaseH domain-containing protein
LTNAKSKDVFLSPSLCDSTAKFYALRRGRQRGIYASWAEMSPHVAGYIMAEFKTFKGFADAIKWVSSPTGD